MSLAQIKGQDKAIGLLKAAFESERLSHAYLFQGPDGVGKETTALAFAKALNCEDTRRTATASRISGGRPRLSPWRPSFRR
jgi:DNA polymerase III gamma/tau subunit